jgi:hypothetical protein
MDRRDGRREWDLGPSGHLLITVPVDVVTPRSVYLSCLC